MSNALIHYGRKGQHWGIRNGPPYPLSRQKGNKSYTKLQSYLNLTPQQRVRKSEKTKHLVDNIIDTLDEEDRYRLGMEGDESYLDLEQGEYLVLRSLTMIDNLPVSFFDLLEDGEKSLNVCLGTRRGDEFRGKGYATKTVDQAMAWVKKNKDKLTQDYIYWSALRTNTASRKLAEKYGFELYEDERWTPDDEWVLYIYDVH